VKVCKASTQRFHKLQTSHNVTDDEFTVFEAHLWYRWLSEKHKTIKRKLLKKRRKSSAFNQDEQSQSSTGATTQALAPTLTPPPTSSSLLSSTQSHSGLTPGMRRLNTSISKRLFPSQSVQTIIAPDGQLTHNSDFPNKRHKAEDTFVEHMISLMESGVVRPEHVIDAALNFQSDLFLTPSAIDTSVNAIEDQHREEPMDIDVMPSDQSRRRKVLQVIYSDDSGKNELISCLIY
jgi:hypothetical protein